MLKLLTLRYKAPKILGATEQVSDLQKAKIELCNIHLLRVV